MGKIEMIARPGFRRERKHRRFPLSFPVQVKFHAGDLDAELHAVSRNVSVGGMLLEAASPIPHHCPVSFTLTLQGGDIVRPIQLVGEGEVVRVQPQETGTGFAIAVQCRQPLTEVANLG
jgi:hypothetical protein